MRLHGTYREVAAGFLYNKLDDHYVCLQGNIIPLKKVFCEGHNPNKKKEYRTSKYIFRLFAACSMFKKE